MHKMEDKNLDLIQINKLILIRKLVCLFTFSNFLYQLKYMDKIKDLADMATMIYLTYWVLWTILVIFIIISFWKNKPQLVYI